MSINNPHTPSHPKLRNKKQRLRRKQRHQYKIKQTNEQKNKKLNNRLNHNKYNTWDSETIKPLTTVNSIKHYYLYVQAQAYQ